MHEVFEGLAAHFGESVQGVVGKVFFAFAAVLELLQVAVSVVVVAAPVKGLAVEGQCAAIGRFDLADFVFFETSLFVVLLVLGDQAGAG